MSACQGDDRLPLLGVVLAGGDSRRFGSPKALARLHGKPLWRLAAERLAAVCDRVEVSANDARVAGAVGATAGVFADRRTGAGPLGGMHAAWERALELGTKGVLVAAVDTPWVPTEALRRLAGEWRAHGRPSVAASGPPWGFEPLTAVYPVASLEPLEAALRRGVRKAGEFARSLDPLVVDTGTAPARFRSVNRPEDLPPPACSIVGNKNHFRVDTPGTDSWRHRHEGSAERVLLAGPDEFALMGGWDRNAEPPLDLLLCRHLSDAEIVIVEGYRHERLPKVEVFRPGAQPEPVLGPAAARGGGVLAAVTDRADPQWSVPVLDPGAADVAARVADMIERALL